jgi:hypothetical protein
MLIILINLNVDNFDEYVIHRSIYSFAVSEGENPQHEETSRQAIYMFLKVIKLYEGAFM